MGFSSSESSIKRVCAFAWEVVIRLMLWFIALKQEIVRAENIEAEGCIRRRSNSKKNQEIFHLSGV